MFFAITLLSEGGQWRDLSFSHPNLEDGLETVNRLASGNETLLKVNLYDEFGSIELPVEVFDGTPLSQLIRELQPQWEQALVAVSPVVVRIDADSFLERADESRRKLVDNIKYARSRVQQLLERATTHLTDYQQKDLLINHYQKIIDHYEWCLTSHYANSKAR